MNILMIGHSRSGKTSYMAGLYRLYGDDPKGFGLWMSDTTKREKLTKLGINVEKGIYPEGTDIAEEYKFWLQYDNSLLIPFNWYDYRGGALLESSKTSKDAEDLVKRISNADALIVFLDGEKITRMTDDELEDEYEVLMWAIQKAISNKSSDDNYYPVSFVITKGDLYDNYSDLIDSPGIDFFFPLLKNIAKSKNSVCMIGVVEVSPDGISNVSAPLFFSLNYGLHHYVEERLTYINSEIQKYEDRSWIGRVWHSDDFMEKMQSEKNKLEELEALSNILQKIVNKLKEDKKIIVL